jgi:DNA-binding CsgD family transcriptional regulator
MASDRFDRATIQLSRIASRAQDHLSAQADALAVIRQVVPFDVGSIATVDPATVLWTSCVVDGLERDPRREAFMFENEYRQDDLLKISTLAQGPDLAQRLSAIEPSERERSIRYQVIRQYGAGDELRCALVDAGNCWGSFEIYRAEGNPSFTDSDCRLLTSLSRPMARLVRLALLRQAAAAPEAVDEPPAVVMLGDDFEIAAMSPASQRWLDELDGATGTPPVIRSLALRLVAGEREAVSMVAPRSAGGWLRLHATSLVDATGARTVSVVLEPVKPAVLPVAVAGAYGFTPRETEVITWMARGLSAKEIGGRLGISPYTVNDHAKSIFQKAGVQSRQQLIAALFFDHCLPHRQRDAIPGPYGWFLDGSPVTGPADRDEPGQTRLQADRRRPA